MDTEKIQKLEQEIKDLCYSPAVEHNRFSDHNAKEFLFTFWDFHLKPVIELSKQMADKYQADMEVVWLGAILHDVARLTNEEPHDEIGAEKAYKMLIDKGFESEVSEKVKHVVLSHRVKEHLPENLEQKIIATADAMSHFLQPFYVWMGRYNSSPFQELLKKISVKIERDFNEKIFFDDERDMVEGYYNMLKKWSSTKG